MVEEGSLPSPLTVVFGLSRDFRLSRSCQGAVFGQVLCKKAMNLLSEVQCPELSVVHFYMHKGIYLKDCFRKCLV